MNCWAIIGCPCGTLAVALALVGFVAAAAYAVPETDQASAEQPAVAATEATEPVVPERQLKFDVSDKEYPVPLPAQDVNPKLLEQRYVAVFRLPVLENPRDLPVLAGYRDRQGLGAGRRRATPLERPDISAALAVQARSRAAGEVERLFQATISPGSFGPSGFSWVLYNWFMGGEINSFAGGRSPGVFNVTPDLSALVENMPESRKPSPELQSWLTKEVGMHIRMTSVISPSMGPDSLPIQFEIYCADRRVR